MRDRVTRALALIGLFGAAGCELAEVTTPEGRDLLVVEGVLRAGDHRQSLLLHRTLQGNVVWGEPGARVVVRTPQGEEVVLQEGPLSLCAENLAPLHADSLDVRASCYSAPLRVVPGDTYELHVSTLDERTLRGRTTVPADFDLRVPSIPRGGTCSLAPLTNLPLVWSESSGAWAYFARMGVSGLREAFAGTDIQAPEFLQLTGLAISQRDTTMLLPAEFGVFDRFDTDLDLLIALQAGLPAGARVEVALSAADRNYVNGVRGGAFNPSGNVRISSIVGDGVGIFGSLVIRRFQIVVGADASLPRCAG
jgi:hypothetical protein